MRPASHRRRGGRRPAPPGSRCEFDLAARFTAIFTGSHVWFEGTRARHHDAAAKSGDPLPGYPPGVDDPAAGDEDAWGAVRPRAAKVQSEIAGQFMLSVLDLQAADGPPSVRDPGQQAGPEADLRVGPGVQEAGPGQQPV